MLRREFLYYAGAAAMATALEPVKLHAEARSGSFDFLFVTDSHIQPELDASKGCEMAFSKAHTFKADFAIQGGDHVFDAEDVTRERAKSILDLYEKTEQDLGMKVYHTCGNHDCFGISSKGRIAQSDPMYGKKYFEERFGNAHYSFDHKGVHFLILDSVQPLPGGAGYVGNIDDGQLAWIAADLAKLPPKTPIIAAVHVPLVTAIDSYGKMPTDHLSVREAGSVENSDEVIKIFDSYNVIGVLQGHTDIWEQVNWHGVTYVTGGAICGNWWRGTRMGTPEGFNIVRVENGAMSVRYETYGFKSANPQNT